MAARSLITRGRLAVLLAAAMLAAAMGIPKLQGAHAGAEVCNPACVVLIEVDGLEAKDVTPQTTPFLWALGHSGEGVGNVAGNPLNISPVAIGAAQIPGIRDRNGFIWQAARGVMSATTQASTVSLLTGGYPQQTGVPSDDFVTPDGRTTLGGRDKVVDANLPTGAKTLLTLVHDAGDDPTTSVGKGAAIVGDPRLRPLFVSEVDTSLLWAPATTDSVPAYCPIPQDADEATVQGEGYAAGDACPTPDANTAKHAGDALLSTDGAKVSLAYVHLAELGAVKRLHGDLDQSTTPAAQAVASQLVATDAAIGSLIGRVAQNDPTKWGKTVVMVVGNHGYELASQAHRVPDPDNTNNPGMGLTDLVSRASDGAAVFVPQGSVGFVYASDDSKLPHIVEQIRRVDDTPLCQAGAQADGVGGLAVSHGCIQEILATGAVDSGGHSTVPGVDSVQDKHPGWHLHDVDAKGKSTDADGDLMVVLKPRWATGALVPVKNTNSVPNPTTLYGVGDGGGSIENPYIGSAGGPRNRAIAAVVNGPSNVVRQVETDGTYPVSNQALDPGQCPTHAGDFHAAGGDVNANPGDDADAPGHECQAETVDFAPTIGALLHLGVPFSQIGGRFLQEAFTITLGLPEEDVVAPPPPDDAPPPPPEPDVRIPDPPPPPKGFDFFGLLRGLSASVVDENGCTWQTARPGSRMDYLKIEGDFGRQLSSATLTFYQRKAGAKGQRGKAKAHAAVFKRTYRALAGNGKTSKCIARKGAKARKAAKAKRPPLRAIARFKPFALKRGHVVLRLRIPDLYRPTHVGLFVQEARKLKVPQVGANGKPGLSFTAFGPAAGQIVRLTGGGRLHATKPGGRKSPKRKRGKAKHGKGRR